MESGDSFFIKKTSKTPCPEKRFDVNTCGFLKEVLFYLNSFFL
jgi:hypothetical protein